MSRPAEHGFTLIELLVVLAIIGLATSAVILAAPDPRGDLRSAAERFAARTRAAQDAAVIEARDFALRIDRDGYGFERRDRGGWHTMDQRPFLRESWPEGATAQAQTSRIRFDPTGLSDPLTLNLVHDEAQVTVRIAADGTIHVL